MSRPNTRGKNPLSLAVTRMREVHGPSMEAFAKRLRVALNTVSRWENSRPPSGKSLEMLYRFAKKHGPATSTDMLLRAITREKSEEFRRYRAAEILDAANLQDVRILLRKLWNFEEAKGNVDPLHEPERREYLLKFSDRLCLGGRKEFLGEVES
jgi:transcriptional regulator with XRE-family HTH domain